MNYTTIFYISIAFLAALGLVYYQYFWKQKISKTNFILGFLRLLSIFCLLLLLINPSLEKTRLEKVKPMLFLAIDNSSSIQHLQQENTVKQIVNQFTTNTYLKDKFEIKQFTFGEKLSHLDSLYFNENQTNINEAVADLNVLSKSIKSPIVILSDGNQTLGKNYTYINSKQQIFPIVIGDTTKYEDVSIAQINVNSYSFLNNQFPVEVVLNYSGEKKYNLDFIVKNKQEILFKKKVSFSSNKRFEKINFYLTAKAVGKQVFEAVISPLPTEKNTVNNRKNFYVDVINEQSEITLIYDVLHPDIGALKKSIESNKQRKVNLVKVDKFDYDFEKSDVLILYQPNSKFQKIFTALKNSEQSLFIITGMNTNWSFLNSAQNYFHKNVLQQQENYLAKLATDFSAFAVEDIDFEKFPPIEDYFGSIQFKVENDVIANQIMEGMETKNPVIATFKQDNRRGVALFGEHIWRWRMAAFTQQNSFLKFDTFINQLLQYLTIVKGKRKIEVAFNPINYINDEVIIKAKPYDANFNFDKNAQLNLILNNDGKKIPFQLGNLNFEANLINLKPGDYEFRIIDKKSRTLFEGKFAVANYAVEQEKFTANLEGLKQLALHSKGAVFYPSTIDNLINRLINNSEYKTVQKETKQSVSFIDWKWLLALITLSLSIEWFIRKYRGLV